MSLAPLHLTEPVAMIVIPKSVRQDPMDATSWHVCGPRQCEHRPTDVHRASSASRDPEQTLADFSLTVDDGYGGTRTQLRPLRHRDCLNLHLHLHRRQHQHQLLLQHMLPRSSNRSTQTERVFLTLDAELFR